MKIMVNAKIANVTQRLATSILPSSPLEAPVEILEKKYEREKHSGNAQHH